MIRIGICGHILNWGGWSERHTTKLINKLAVHPDFDVFVFASSDPGLNTEAKIIQTSVAGNRVQKAVENACKFGGGGSPELDVVYAPTELVPPYFWRIDAERVIEFGGDCLLSEYSHLCRDVLSTNLLLSYALIRAFHRRISRVIVPSEMMVANISNRFKVPRSDLNVIPHAVDNIFVDSQIHDPSKILSKYDIDPPYIVHVSGFRKIKNTPTIVEAVRHLPTEVRENLQLVFVGERKNEYPVVQEKIESYGLDANFLGYVDSELPAIYAQAELLCQPSFRETFGFPIIESIACGTPVVTSDNIGVLLDNNHHQIETNVTDPDDVSDGIKRILSSPDSQGRVEADRYLVETHRWDNVVEQYQTVFRTLAVLPRFSGTDQN